jgi:hypothetical protein
MATSCDLFKPSSGELIATTVNKNVTASKAMESD